MRCDVCGKSCVTIFPLPWKENQDNTIFACLACQLKDMENEIKQHDPDDPDHERDVNE